MDQRTKNRLREHTASGHSLSNHNVNLFFWGAPKDKVFCRCTCSWFGWLNIRPEEIEKYGILEWD